MLLPKRVLIVTACLIFIGSFSTSCKQVTLVGDKKSEQQLTFLEKRISLLTQRVDTLEQHVQDLAASRPTDTDSIDGTSVSEAAKAESEDTAIVPDVVYLADDTGADDPFIGSESPEYVVIVFTDLLCGTCKDFLRNTLPEVQSLLVSKEGFQLRLRDFPLEKSAFSESAAYAAHCAGENGAYWQFLELLSGSIVNDKAELLELAGKLPGLDVSAFTTCVSSSRYTREIQLDKEAGTTLGITGVPSAFVGLRVSDTQFKGFLIRGNQTPQVYLHYLEKLITSQANPN